jgi:hypothetical protein
MGKYELFHTIPDVARRWALTSVRNASGGAVRLNLKDGCGMIGENLFLGGT